MVEPFEKFDELEDGQLPLPDVLDLNCVLDDDFSGYPVNLSREHGDFRGGLRKGYDLDPEPKEIEETGIIHRRTPGHQPIRRL